MQLTPLRGLSWWSQSSNLLILKNFWHEKANIKKRGAAFIWLYSDCCGLVFLNQRDNGLQTSRNDANAGVFGDTKKFCFEF
jgi:hypothetical protein